MGADELEEFGDHIVGYANVLREEVVVIDVGGVGGPLFGVGFPGEVMDYRGREGGRMAGVGMINSGVAAWGGGMGWWCPREIDDSGVGTWLGEGRVGWQWWFALEGRSCSAMVCGVCFGSRSFRSGVWVWGRGRLVVDRVGVRGGVWCRCVVACGSCWD